MTWAAAFCFIILGIIICATVFALTVYIKEYNRDMKYLQNLGGKNIDNISGTIPVLFLESLPVSSAKQKKSTTASASGNEKSSSDDYSYHNEISSKKKNYN